jgi:small subunit ribosomal protein S8
MITSTDPIADLLTRMRNAVRAGHKRVDVPASNLKKAIINVLAEQKYISKYSEITDNKQGVLRVVLKYNDGQNAITDLQRVSKPGRRMYVAANEVPRVLNGLGIAILSTSSGVITDKQAKEQHVGGEVLCHIW